MTRRQRDKETTRQERDGILSLSPCLPVSVSILVVGYGNELRGDDAAGPRIAREVAAWGLPQVRTLAAHQLTPELAAELAHADAAIFVDAYLTDAAAANVYLRPIASCNRSQLGAHLGDPGA